jgi:ssDNA-binding Zn-finger/Zn-ribbon topoisomerase 1
MQQSDYACPTCGSPLVLRQGQRGGFLRQTGRAREADEAEARAQALRARHAENEAADAEWDEPWGEQKGTSTIIPD